MSYNAILKNLYVGDYEAAKDLTLLEKLGVTHVVACGFDQGHFETKGKFKYFCIDILDTPTSNLLQFLPRVTAFLQNVIDKNNSVAFVHCVHGQSRSCAVCIAYLINQSLQHKCVNEYSIDDDDDYLNYDDDDDKRQNIKYHKNLLDRCYIKVQQQRPQMAINPGFVEQLEIFRRMKCIQVFQNKRTIIASSSSSTGVVYIDENDTGDILIQDKMKKKNDGIATEKRNRHKEKNKVPIQSKTHALFRSFRCKSEYWNTGTISHKFCPIILQSNRMNYHCNQCNELLFTEMNILEGLLKEEVSTLPISDYWKDSQGGIDYSNMMQSLKSKNVKHDVTKKNKFQSTSFSNQEHIMYKVEPMQWMHSQMFKKENIDMYGSSVCSSSNNGKLDCPICVKTLGYWDWCNNQIDLFTAIIIFKDKIRVE